MKKAPKLTTGQKEELSLAIKTAKHSDSVRKAQAILCINEQMSEELIQRFCGYSRKRAESLRREYFKEGIVSIDAKTRGIRSLLSRQELEEIVDVVKTKKPREVMHYQSDYWNTSILGRHIKEKYNVKYKSKTSYCLIFRQAKFSFHKPGKVYKGHDEEEVQRWISQNKQKIEDALKDENTIGRR